MQIWIYTLVSVFGVSLISLLGIVFLLNKKFFRKASLFLVSFAVGALFGDAFIHLLPESFEKISSKLAVSILTMVGVLSFFVLEKFVRWRHCHIPSSREHVHPFVTMNLLGDTIHNLIDGMLIGASFLVSFPIGITTTVAIALHEIPQEIGDFSVFLHGGLSPKKALLFNFLSALAAVLGAVGALIIGLRVQGFGLALLPVTAGGFLYIAGSDLIPELHHETKISTSLGQLISIMLGIGIMMFLFFLE
jgi:zinc and cadmium transporter